MNSEPRRLPTTNTFFSDIKQELPDSVWKLINGVLGRERKSLSPTKITRDNGDFSVVALAEHFNSHFTNVGVPISAGSAVETLVDGIFLDPTNEIEI